MDTWNVTPQFVCFLFSGLFFPFLSVLVLVLLSAHVKRFSVARIQFKKQLYQPFYESFQFSLNLKDTHDTTELKKKNYQKHKHFFFLLMSSNRPLSKAKALPRRSWPAYQAISSSPFYISKKQKFIYRFTIILQCHCR